MNKIDRMQAVLRNEVPDVTPAGFWYHYAGHDSIEQMARNHLDLYQLTDMDIIKVMQDYPYPKLLDHQPDTPAEWRSIRFPGQSSPEFKKLAAVLQRILDQAGQEVMVFQTMFGPTKAACMAFGDDTLMRHARQDPDAVAAGLSNIADGLAEWAAGYLEMGAAGIYYSAQFGEVGRFNHAEWEHLVKRTDLQVLAIANGCHRHNILHICGEPEYNFETHIDRYGDYPASLINWSVKDNHYSLERGRDFFRKPVLGGLNNKGNILNGTEEDIRREVQSAIWKFGQKGLMIGADCTIQGKNIDPQKIRIAVDAAHQFKF